jgi:hypothetical protein
MDRTEKVSELLKRLENLGFRLQFDCGLMTAIEAPEGDPEKRRMLMEELGKYFRELSYVLQQRAIGARAKELRGQSVWSPEFGEGVLAGADGGPGLTVSFQNSALRSPQTIRVNADSVLIVVQKDAEGPPSLVPDEPRSTKSSKGFLGQLLRRNSTE